jgi:hypothetical protein
MTLNLDITTRKKLTSTTRQYKTPKSIRLQQFEIQQLETFKNRLKDLTLSEHCSDTQAFKVMLRLTYYITDNALKKALSSSL